MAITLSANKTSLSSGESLVLTASGSSENTYINYGFSRGSTVVGSGASPTLTINPVSPSDSGQYTVMGTISNDPGAPTTETSPAITISVTNKSMTGVTLALSSPDESYTVGDEYEVTATVTGAPGEATTTYVWTVNGSASTETGNKLTGTTPDVETLAITCVSTSKATNYNDFSTPSKSISFAVEPAPIPVPEGGYAYVHPLPWRDTAFIQVGWWVIDEISRANQLGIDWKYAPDPLRYKKDLLTLAKMFEDYDEVEVQESRNGYIWGKSQIEAGYIY